jgi:hypothetical protein
MRWKPKGRFMMNHGIFLLFAIPALCIIVVAFAQFGDEMFKRKFIIERRNRTSNGGASGNRRYNDPKGPVAQSEATPQSSEAKDTPNLETSGIRN